MENKSIYMSNSGHSIDTSLFKWSLGKLNDPLGYQHYIAQKKDIIPPIIPSESSNIQNILIIRHAEKPQLGLGQLTCKGYNRAEQWGWYFNKHFSHLKSTSDKLKERSGYIFAPNPQQKHVEMHDNLPTHGEYYYLRPLATIEPTAISFGLPINLQFDHEDYAELGWHLLNPKYHSSDCIIAWEHSDAVKLATWLTSEQSIAPGIILKPDADIVIPCWINQNYDMIFKITIDWNKRNVSFCHSKLTTTLGEPSERCSFDPTHNPPDPEPSPTPIPKPISPCENSETCNCIPIPQDGKGGQEKCIIGNF